MRKTLKKYFIPHKENNFHPHILHAKRAFMYGGLFLAVKAIVVLFVLFLPVEVFVMPDVLAEEQKQIVALTNEVRVGRGLPALTMAVKLNTSAQYKADDMSLKGYFVHTENNQTVATWLKSAGYKYETAGENLAVGYSTAQDIVNAWKNSPTHYANLIDTDFVDLGVGLAGGIYDGQPTVFIAQHLASPLSFVKTVKEPVKTIVKSTETNPEVNQVEISKTSNATTSVLSVKIENITPTTDPVMNLKAPTPMDKYIQAKSVLSPITNIFEVSRNIYLGAIFFFVSALLLSLFFEIHKKHPHVIFQTSGLIALLIVLWKF